MYLNDRNVFFGTVLHSKLAGWAAVLVHCLRRTALINVIFSSQCTELNCLQILNTFHIAHILSIYGCITLLYNRPCIWIMSECINMQHLKKHYIYINIVFCTYTASGRLYCYLHQPRVIWLFFLLQFTCLHSATWSVQCHCWSLTLEQRPCMLSTTWASSTLSASVLQTVRSWPRLSRSRVIPLMSCLALALYKSISTYIYKYSYMYIRIYLHACIYNVYVTIYHHKL